jgi:hypothetical protein
MDGSRRWVGVGRSSAAASRSAGREAAADAVRGADPRLLVAFAGIDHDPQALLAGIADAAPGVPLIGCSTHGEIGPGGPRDGSVTVAALGGPGFTAVTACADRVSERQREAGAAVATELATAMDGATATGAARPHQVMIMLTDGLARAQEEILRGVYGVFGATVPLFGGAAADAWRMSRTFQLCDGQVFENGVVAALLASEAPLAVAASHGWRRVGEPLVVTSAGDARVYEFDDRPALDSCLDRLGAPKEIYHDPCALIDFLLPRPLGVQRRSGVEVRNMSTEIDLEGRSIGGGGAFAPGAVAWVMEGDSESILASLGSAFVQARAGLDGAPPIGLLTLSCAASRAVLGDEGIRREGTLIEREAGGVPFAGFHTYGEIARTRGIDGFHNQTFVVLALA